MYYSVLALLAVTQLMPVMSNSAPPLPTNDLKVTAKPSDIAVQDAPPVDKPYIMYEVLSKHLVNMTLINKKGEKVATFKIVDGDYIQTYPVPVTPTVKK